MPAPPPAGASPPPAFGAPGGYGQPAGYGYGVPVEKAGFWARFAALLIDVIITGLFCIPAYVALVAGPTRVTTCSVDESGTVTGFGDDANALCEVPTGGTWAIFGVLLVLGIIAGIVYWAKLEGGKGQTLGKQALGIKTVDIRTGTTIGSGRAVGRYFARILSELVCFLGYLWMLWDPDKQTWHDKIVDSVVIRA